MMRRLSCGTPLCFIFNRTLILPPEMSPNSSAVSSTSWRLSGNFSAIWDLNPYISFKAIANLSTNRAACNISFQFVLYADLCNGLHQRCWDLLTYNHRHSVRTWSTSQIQCLIRYLVKTELLVGKKFDRHAVSMNFYPKTSRMSLGTEADGDRDMCITTSPRK